MRLYMINFKKFRTLYYLLIEKGSMKSNVTLEIQTLFILRATYEFINPKLEIRNTKQKFESEARKIKKLILIKQSSDLFLKFFWSLKFCICICLEFWNLGFRISYLFRISDLGFRI